MVMDISIFWYLETVHCCDIRIGEYDEPGHDGTDEFSIFEKFNNSIATKLCTNLLNNHLKKGALHNLMTKLCSALFKYENKLKIGWEN